MDARRIRELISIINNKRFTGFKGYKMGLTLGVFLSTFAERVTWRSSLGSLAHGFAVLNYCISDSGGGNKLFLYTPSYMERVLFKEEFRDISRLADDRRLITSNTRKMRFSPRSATNILLILPWLFETMQLPLNTKQRLYIMGLMGQCRSWLAYFRNAIKNNPPALVTTFCDAHMLDNITVQYCRKKGIPTATLQHALFFYNNELFQSSFELMVSDKILVWGEQSATAAQLYGIHSDKIYVAGPLSTVSGSHRVPDTKTFGVVLSGGSDSMNNALVAIANETAKILGCRYVIRPHPNNDVKNTYGSDNECLESVNDNSQSLEFFTQQVGFILCVSGTTALFEMMRMGAVVFKFNYPYKQSFPEQGELSFSTTNEVIDILKSVNDDIGAYFIRTDRIISHVFGYNDVSAYKLFFKMYNEGE